MWFTFQICSTESDAGVNANVNVNMNAIVNVKVMNIKHQLHNGNWEFHFDFRTCTCSKSTSIPTCMHACMHGFIQWTMNSIREIYHTLQHCTSHDDLFQICSLSLISHSFRFDKPNTMHNAQCESPHHHYHYLVSLTREEAIAATREGEEQLEVLKRQVIIGNMYPSDTNVMETAKWKSSKVALEAMAAAIPPPTARFW